MTDDHVTLRPAHRIVGEAFGLYRCYPLLFFVLATGVIVPYQAIVLASTGSGPFAQGSLSFGVQLLLTLVDWVLIGPLISALHVHAVSEIREGRKPHLATVARQGLVVLPVVAAASIISGIGTALGFVALIVPGIFLALRWAVVAQAAAIEHEGWLPALRRSHQLTEEHYGHIFVFFLYVGLIVLVPGLLLGIGFGHHSTTAASFLVGLVVHVFAASFGALASALLYFDLRAHYELLAWKHHFTGDQAPVAGDSRPVSHSWDPREYSDQARPSGWYIDPVSPDRMRYWSADDPPGWGGSTRTPRKIKRAWVEKDQARS